MSNRIFKRLVLPVVAVLSLAVGTATAEEKVRVGVLKFGTVNWEIETIAREGFDKANGFEMEVVQLAGNDATKVALESGEVDIIVSDWLHVARQRAEGQMLTFVPYSTSVGAVMVPCDGEVKALPDLKDKKIGVAGGPLDKSWLMIQGLAEGQSGFDLKGGTEQAFGAPPLLAEKLKQGELGAALNYWHYNARLETEGYCPLVSAQEAARSLGAEGDISAIGYVFSEDWANAHKDAALGFVKASRDAKDLLAASDEAWDKIRPMMKADDDKVFETLKLRYREGIPTRAIADEERDTGKVYDYLAKVGGEKLVGKAKTMPAGTFWTELKNGT